MTTNKKTMLLKNPNSSKNKMLLDGKSTGYQNSFQQDSKIPLLGDTVL